MNHSLAAMMDDLVALEETIHDDLRVYRWRPTSLKELPAVYNWLRPGRAENDDPCKVRDLLDMSVRVGVRQTDTGEGMERLEEYADAARQVFDVTFAQSRPLGLSYAKRTGMGAVYEQVGDTPVLAIEFRFELPLDSLTTPQGS